MATDNRNLYWGDLAPDRINASGLSGGGVTEIIGSADAANPYGVAVDTVQNKLYFTSQGTNEILKSDLDGSNIVVLASGADGVSTPLGLAIHIADQQLYIADYATDEIFRVDVDGGNFTVVASGADGLNLPISIAIDEVNDKLFINNQGDSEILKGNLDGSSLSAIVTSQAGLQSIAIHQASGFIFWTQNPTVDRVARAELDGSNVTGIVTTGYLQLRGIAVDVVNDKVLFTNDAATYTITKCNLDGSSVTDIFASGTGSIRDLDIDQIPSISGGIDLFLEGPAGGDIDLFEHGFDSTSGNVTLFVSGVFSATMDLFLKVLEFASGSLDTFIHGFDSTSGNIDLFTNGHILSSSGTDLFVHGHSPISTSGDLFISGPIEISGGIDLYIANSGSIDSWTVMVKGFDGTIDDEIRLRIYGTTTAGVGIPASDFDLFIQNSGDDVVDPPLFTGSFPGFVKTEDWPSPTSGYWPMFAHVEGSLDKSATLFIHAGPNVSGDTILFIKQDPGWLVTPGWGADRNDWPFFAEVFDGVSSGIDLFVSGIPPSSTSLSGSIDCFIPPHQIISGDLDMFLFGISGTESGSMTLFIIAESGFIDSNRILYTHGF